MFVTLLICKCLCQELCTDLGMSGVCPCFISVEQPLACYVTNTLVNILPANRTEGNVKGGRYTYRSFQKITFFKSRVSFDDILLHE